MRLRPRTAPWVILWLTLSITFLVLALFSTGVLRFLLLVTAQVLALVAVFPDKDNRRGFG
ncbi:hypothetical protein [Actinophytocola xanthii]|uniref:Uncharacterized protein n=1 Tax=Actinophytocola xanthii TaxID=1912961 RepID=A0A1Q8CP05_9PSEU|nr:hypothetical protein [Actinophytocola xanthii]OLF16093.1 hypothetical protein BU204_18235 [Actinophytocola xanthii]